MRRFLAVLVLICSAWLQVAAANCPVGLLPGNAGAVTAHEVSASHGSQITPHEHHSENRSCHHGNHDCSVLMACCVAALTQVTLSPSEIKVVVGLPIAELANLYVSSNLASDPPPPRLLI